MQIILKADQEDIAHLLYLMSKCSEPKMKIVLEDGRAFGTYATQIDCELA
jgi:hypothetical protein